MEKTFNGSKLKIERDRVRPQRANHYYHVELLEGRWPDDGAVISLCDGGDGISRSDFGGTVSKTVNKAFVTVYVD